MSADFVADQPVCSFRDFTVETSPEKVRSNLFKEPTCLADYIRVWVECGEGVHACLGDYQVFLIAVIAIINDWRTDPKLLDYVTDGDPVTGESEIIERRLGTIFGEDDLRHIIFDPHWFATFVFRELHSSSTKL